MAQDLTGWSFDMVAKAGVASLTSLGSIAPGESVLVSDADTATAFRSEWGLKDTVKVA